VPTIALVWFRRDLRVHDHPSLTAARREYGRVVPVFVLDRRLLRGRFPSRNRAWFLLASLAELRAALRERGADLVVREGRPEEELPALAREVGAAAVYFASDVSPFAMARDRRVEAALEGVEVRRQAGLFVADVGQVRTKDGRPHSVFTPFHRAWERVRGARSTARRAVSPSPPGSPSGACPRRASRRRATRSRRASAPAGRGRVRAPTRLARLLRARAAQPPRQRPPRPPAGVRRARVGRRRGVCGDEASNNGNWQWIASVGVDPAPYFRRVYKPMTQQRRHDPDGAYVRRWLPELRVVPDAKLAEPWTMSAAEQRAAGCVIGEDYPAPVVDHKQERRRALARYGAVSAGR
jgi:deoxyribodipyrimidine photolyase